MWCSADTNDTPSARSTPLVSCPSDRRLKGYESWTLPCLNGFAQYLKRWTNSLTLSRCVDLSFFSVQLAKPFQFQHELLMSLTRFLRIKSAQQRDALLRVKHEREEVKGLRKYAGHVHRMSS